MERYGLMNFKKIQRKVRKDFLFFPLYYYFGGRNSLLYFKFSNFIETDILQ